jgi:hypothetical protein
VVRSLVAVCGAVEDAQAGLLVRIHEVSSSLFPSMVAIDVLD